MTDMIWLALGIALAGYFVGNGIDNGLSRLSASDTLREALEAWKRRNPIKEDIVKGTRP